MSLATPSILPLINIFSAQWKLKRTAPQGDLLRWTGESRIENQTAFRERDEEYIGLGFNAEWQATERLSIIADIGYSETSRFQDELDMRIRTVSSLRTDFEANTIDRTIPSFMLLEDLDLNDYDNFTTDGERARRRLETNDEDIISFRLDTDYEMSGNFLTSVKVGARYTDRNRVNDDGIDTTISGITDYSTAEVAAARNEVFPVTNLFDGAEADSGIVTSEGLQNKIQRQIVSGMFCQVQTSSLRYKKISFCVLRPTALSQDLMCATCQPPSHLATIMAMSHQN